MDANFTRSKGKTSPQLRQTRGNAPDCLKERTIKEFKNLPCSLWLTGRVHEEECDGSFSVNRLKTKNCVCFFGKENGKKEMIK